MYQILLPSAETPKDNDDDEEGIDDDESALIDDNTAIMAGPSDATPVVEAQ